MNTSKNLSIILIMLSFLYTIPTSFAQIEIKTASGVDLAEQLTGTGVNITNVQLNCPGNASGSFSNGSSTNIGLDKGIVLTSGHIDNVKGPNNQESKGTSNGGPSDADLENLIITQTFDRCVLEFDLESIGDKVTFQYVFASEEYKEYVCSNFNDVFAFFVSGPKPGGGTYNKENIAKIPGTNNPVTINFVNHGSVGSNGSGSNCSPPNGSLAFSSFYRDNPPSPTTTIQYDGFTVKLTAEIDLIPCKTYHFKLGVADAGDRRLDSGVFIEAGSFNSNEILAEGEITKPACPGACDGSIDITPMGGKAPYGFAWSNGKTTQDISGLCAGNYTVTITDANGCEEEISFTLPDGIDSTNPDIACPSDITKNNDTGVCGAKVDFTVTATDDCTANPAIVNNPPSGSFFNVGTSFVKSVATDESGNSQSCSFKVTIIDNEKPVVSCPSDVAVSCENPTEPSATGMPGASDNCAVAMISHDDLVTPGSCAEEFTITRTWTVKDVNGNEATCNQTIEVFDNTAPVITCPANITVTCDTTTTSTGLATAIDNCDATPTFTYVNEHQSGDCEWLCVIKRIWTATDNCGNASSCEQIITKDVTPLIEDALEADLDGDGKIDTLVMGVTKTTLTIDPSDASCIVAWLPETGDTPFALKRTNQEVATDCSMGSNPLDDKGKTTNPLFSEALKLQLILRLHPTFGETDLSEFDCEVAPIVLQKLPNNPKVKNLMEVTQIALGNLVLVPHLKELLEALRCINGPLEICNDPTASS